MKVDASNSIYREDPGAKSEFNRKELRMLRLLLRRLHFLEAQIKKNEGKVNLSGGANFAEWESDALEYVLTEIGFLEDDDEDEDEEDGE